MDRPSPGPGVDGDGLAPRWLLVVPALPRMTAGVRSKTLNRLRRLGAITVEPSMFVLPDSPAAREDVAWLKADVERGGGEMTAFAADSVDAGRTTGSSKNSGGRPRPPTRAWLLIRAGAGIRAAARTASGSGPRVLIGSWHEPPISNASTFRGGRDRVQALVASARQQRSSDEASAGAGRRARRTAAAAG